MIKETVEALVRECEAALLGLQEVRPMPDDIDILVRPIHRAHARAILEEAGFVVVSEGAGKLQAVAFEEGSPYLVDLAWTLQYLGEEFAPENQFPGAFEYVVHDANLERFLRYLYLLRGGEKHQQFIQAHFAEYAPVLSDKKIVGTPVFRKSLSRETALGIMCKNPIALIRGISIVPLVSFGVRYLVRRFRNLGSGTIVAMVGPDGSGKTTIIERLARTLPTKRLYMGDWGFALQPLYAAMHRQHIAIARLTYVFFFIENWIRYARASYWKFLGYVVLVDRYPGLNRHLRKGGFLLAMNDLLYRFFPRADKYIFLSADPEEVHRRKPELSVEEIEQIQKHLRERLPRGRACEIANTDIDRCLAAALRYIVS